MFTTEKVTTTRGRTYIHVLRDGKKVAIFRPDCFIEEVLYALIADDVTVEEDGGVNMSVQFRVNGRFVLGVENNKLELREIHQYVRTINEHPDDWQHEVRRYWDIANPFADMIAMDNDRLPPPKACHGEVLEALIG